MTTTIKVANKSRPGQPLKYGDVAQVSYDPADPILVGWSVDLQVFRTETTKSDIPDQLPDDGIVYQQTKPIATGTAAQNTTFWMSDGPFSESWDGGGAMVIFNLLNAEKTVVDSITEHVLA